MKEIKVAIIGFGGIGGVHKKGYDMLHNTGSSLRLVAVCDVNPERFSHGVDMNLSDGNVTGLDGINTYTDVDELIASEDFDMADICLPTYLHKEYAIKLMRAGKHVLSEKPMALSSVDCDEMINVSKECGVHFMIAQCLRFHSSYLFVKDLVENGSYGKIKHAAMNRLSLHPRWGFEHWFEDTEKSGGCILDMHIHDVDIARFWLGEPYAVSAATQDGITKWQVVNTRLWFDGALFNINCSWDESDTTKFLADFRIRFERATVTLKDRVVTVYPDGGEPYRPEIAKTDCYAEEIRAFGSFILGEAENINNIPESSRESVRIIEALRESAQNDGKTVTV